MGKDRIDIDAQSNNMIVFTEDDLDYCWPHYKTYFLQVLNGEYLITDAKDDLESLIGSRFDERIK